VALGLLLGACAGPKLTDTPDSPFVPTPARVVEEMLDLADVKASDVVYDLGSGDGRIVIAAARRGARAIGVELDAQLVQDSRDKAYAAGLADRITFVWQDVLKTDLGSASVVTLYLFPDLTAKLAPKFLSELRPGTRIVSHRFPVADWTPRRTLTPDSARRPYPVYLYVR
jgi:cyclopropane fatty-acyl-phospholipid synthase-like methyltransferase